MIRKTINVIKSEVKVFTSMSLDGGNSVKQTYNVLSGEYYPNRALVPLVATPQVGYTVVDTKEHVDSASAQLVDGHWYRLDATHKGMTAANEITNGSTYQIDTTVGSATYGRIRIYENIPATIGTVTYVFRARLTAGNSVREISCSLRVDTINTTVAPELYFDNAAEAVYNPWEDPQFFSLNPKISPSGLTVSYSWQSMHDGAWGALGSSLLDWAVDKVGNGIRINRAVMQDQIKLKCIATVTLGSQKITLEKTVTHNRRLPPFKYDIEGVGGISPQTKEISPTALVKASRRVISSDAEILCVWYGTGTTPIGYGINPRIAVASLDTNNDLGLDVKDRGGWKHLMTADGKFIVDSSGKSIIAR